MSIISVPRNVASLAASGERDDMPVAPRLGDVSPDAGERPLISPASAELNRLALDTAVHFNRAGTPKADIEKRSAPRYSIAELNAMDLDQIRDRLDRIPKFAYDNRPGIIKVLDVLDLPRNAIQNALTALVMPDVRRKAIERGDFGTFGLPRVIGADILRGLGLNNDVVDGVGGFAYDVVTDPVSWLFAPAKGASLTASGGGPVLLGATGANTLQRSLKQVARGGVEAVENPEARRLFEETVKAHGIQAADNKALTDALSSKLIGEQGNRIRRAVGTVFGPSGHGGDIAELFGKVAEDSAGNLVRTPEKAEQIRAVKDFVGKNTLNRGIVFGGKKAGTAIAHIPLTNITLTVPSFTRGGKQAVLQRAVAAAMDGSTAKAASLVEAQRNVDRIGQLSNRMQELSDAEKNVPAVDMSLAPTEAHEHTMTFSDIKGRLEKFDPEIVRHDPRAGVGLSATIGERLKNIEDGGDPNASGLIQFYARVHRAEREGDLAKSVTGGIKGIPTSSMQMDDTFSIGRDAARVTDIGDGGVTIEVSRPVTIPGLEGHVETKEFRVPFDEVIPANKGSFSGLGRGPQVPYRPELDAIHEEMDAIEKAINGGWRRTDPNDVLDLAGGAEDDASLAAKLAADAEDEANIRKYVGEDGLHDAGFAGQLTEARNLFQKGRGFDNIDDMGDLLATAELAEQAQSKLREAATLANWRDAERTATRANLPDISFVRKTREQADKAARRAAGIDFETLLDDLAPEDARLAEYNAAREAHLDRIRGRHDQFLRLSESDLDSAERVAKTFQSYVESAAQSADLAYAPIKAALTADARLLAQGAMRSFGLTHDIVGWLPFQGVAAATRSLEKGPKEMAAAALAALAGGADNLEKFGAGWAARFGQGESAINDARVSASRVVSGALDYGNRFAESMIRGGGQFSKGLDEIAKAHGVSVDELPALVNAIAVERRGGGNVHYLTRLADPERPTAAARFLMEAQENGVLKSPELRKDLETFVDELGDSLDESGWESIVSGDLHTLQPREGSAGVPVGLTRESAKRLRDMLGKGGAMGGASVADAASAKRFAEEFQKPRSTWEIRYRDKDGNVRGFLVMDKGIYGNLTDDDLAQWTNFYGAENVEKAREIRDTIKEFESTFGEVNDPAVVQVHGRPLDSFTLREMFGKGEFRAITGGIKTQETFDNNIVDLMARRMSQVRAAQAQDDFFDAVVNMPTALRAETQFASSRVLTTAGEQVKLSDGTIATSVGDGKRIRLGDQTYRILDPSIVNADLTGKIGGIVSVSNIYKTFYPESAAQQIERFYSQMKPEKFDEIMSAANTFTKLWRAQTLFHPSWVTINTIGNMFMLFMDHRGIHAGTLGNRVKQAFDIVRFQNDPEKLRNLVIEVGGRSYRGDELWEAAKQGLVASGGQAEDASDQVFRAVVANSGNGGGLPLGGIKPSFERRRREALIARRSSEATTRAESAKIALEASAHALTDATFKPVFKTWFKLNGSVDDTFRIASMLQHLDSGSDLVGAMARARRGMMTFGDLTDFERKYVRSVVPFYSWTRATLGNLLPRLASDPAYFTAINRMRDLIEETTAGEDKVPWHMRPSWIQQQIGLQIGHDKDGRLAALIGTALPQEQALRVASGVAGAASMALPFHTGFDGQDMMDLFNFAVGQQSPITRAATELGTGRELFSGRTIGKDAESGDIGLGEYLIGQIRLAKEFGIGSVRTGPQIAAFQQGIGPGIGRLLVGGRLQPGLQESRRLTGLSRELDEKVSATRKAIRVAEREGNASASLRARATLMKHYRDHLASGGDPADVPKWARQQLADIGQTE